MKFLTLLQVFVCFGGPAFAFRVEDEAEGAVEELSVDHVSNRSERTNALMAYPAWPRVKVWRCKWFIGPRGVTRRRRLCTHRRRGGGATTSAARVLPGAPAGLLTGVYDIYFMQWNTWRQKIDGDEPRNMTLDCNGKMYEYANNNPSGEQMNRNIDFEPGRVQTMCHDRGHDAQNSKYSREATFYVDRIHEYNGMNNKLECLRYDEELSHEHGGPVLLGDHYDSIRIPEETQYANSPNRVHSWIMYKYKQAESEFVPPKETLCQTPDGEVASAPAGSRHSGSDAEAS